MPPFSHRPLTRKRWMDALVYLSLIIHGIFGILVVMDYSNNTFSKSTVAYMLISCSFSLVYNVLTTLILRDKLIAANPNDYWVSNFSLVAISGLKVCGNVNQKLSRRSNILKNNTYIQVPSFILVAYLSTNDTANPAFTRELFLGSLGQISKTITLVGNQIYLVCA